CRCRAADIPAPRRPDLREIVPPNRTPALRNPRPPKRAIAPYELHARHPLQIRFVPHWSLLRLHCRCRQHEMKCGSPIGPVLRPQPSAMRGDDGAANRKPQPQAAILGGDERVEHALEPLRINAPSAIEHRGANAAVT